MSNDHQYYSLSPALSLSLAGIFRRDEVVAPSRNADTEDAGEEGSGGGRQDNTTTVHEISSENSGLIGRSSRSEDDGGFDVEEGEHEGGDDVEGDDDGEKNRNKKKKRKKYHRHTAEQIREMEILFRESPHPDEKQRQQLSKQLGLAPRQVKFWFQNRRTQIKAIQERHENFLLKSEMDKLREENEALRGIINKACCPNCGVATISSDASMLPEEHQLRVENAKLKAEIEKLRTALAKGPPGSTTSPSSSLGNEQMENRNCLEIYSGIFGLDKTRIMELLNQAMEELIKMATTKEPLWVRSVETSRQILNYDEYVKQFQVEYIGRPSSSNNKRCSIEASRETGVVFLDLPRLLQIFLDVNQWKEMFPSLISKAAIVDVICSGEGPNQDGAVQLMFSELQMLTPMVASREVYFMRYCKQLKEEEWAIVDVSIDKVQDSIESSLLKCRKRPSGCIIQDTCNGHCRVTWVEHIECEKSTVHTMYRSIVNSGLAFGARRWLATLQVQCQRLVFLMATNVPMKDCVGVGTMAGRKSVMKLAQRMTRSLCHAVAASSLHTWTKVSGENGEDIRVSSRKNLNERGEPLGVILCVVSCSWLPVSPNVLVHFLGDETRRTQWHVRSGGEHVQSIVNLAKGKDRCNAVNILAVKSKDDSSNSTWILQDSSTSTYESTVVYAPVDITRMQSVIAGCDSGDVAILPSGFCVVPDGLEAIRPLVITSSSKHHGAEEEEEEKSSEAGSLLTMAFQVLVSTSPAAKLTQESVESATSVMSCTLRNIRTSLQCEDS
ncbi:homeobox-leucine zipper protein GLABRA 2 [Neltuma alba]|uniref:homeobox-leucine zipper protein GLABRA 2 n=1 Tax=Neltuma alba TaxID=207710 RepID=UPI0010A59125|nr:homeobox-leucine zipper protein GLABRA 2-like [Prosopis alba]